MLTTNEQTELDTLLTVEEPNEWMKKRIAELKEKAKFSPEKDEQTRQFQERQKRFRGEVYKNTFEETRNGLRMFLKDDTILAYREGVISYITENIKEQAYKFYSAEFVDIIDTKLPKDADTFFNHLRDQIILLPEIPAEATKMQKLINTRTPYLGTALKASRADYYKIMLEAFPDFDNHLEVIFSIDGYAYMMLLSLTNLLAKEYELSIHNRTVWEIAISNVQLTIVELTQTISKLTPKLKFE